MAAKILELRAKAGKIKKEANEALEAAQAKATAEGRALTAEELKAQDEYDTKLAALDQEIALEQKKIDRDQKYGPSQPTAENGRRGVRAENVRLRAEDDPARGFRNPAAFLLSLTGEPDSRVPENASELLGPLAIRDHGDREPRAGEVYILPAAFTPRSLLAAAGSDEQGGYADRYGGFSVPTTMLPGMLQVGADPDPTAGRTQSVPMATPSVELLARVDKNHATSVSGGFTVSRRPETAAATSSRMEMEKITLRASSLFGLSYATEEILTDSAISFAAIIASGFADQFPHQILHEKLRGNGGAEFKGILNDVVSGGAGSTISVAEETSQAGNTILAENVINMRSRCWGYSNAIWMANHDCYPQLSKIAAVVSSVAVSKYQESLVDDRPDRLLGRPIFYTEYCSTLGDPGDVILANWSQYLEGLYQPLQSAESVHVRFLNHERAFKFWVRNAGSPWWRSPLTPHKGQTLAPFVILDNRD